MSSSAKEKIIKSKARVRDQGEVFTPVNTVNDMLSMISDDINDINKSVLEPSCGNGNFLVAILERRINKISKKLNIKKREFQVLIILTKIYGIDIMHDNIIEARKRLIGIVNNYFSDTKNSSDFLIAASTIVERNIIVGDSLKHKSEIKILEWTPIDNTTGFEINPHTLSQIETDLKDVVTATMINDIKDSVDSIFAQKADKKIINNRQAKITSKQSSLRL